MTVGELIKKLERANPRATVMVSARSIDEEWAYLTDVETHLYTSVVYLSGEW
jgi:hypothetical protein